MGVIVNPQSPHPLGNNYPTPGRSFGPRNPLPGKDRTGEVEESRRDLVYPQVRRDRRGP